MDAIEKKKLITWLRTQHFTKIIISLQSNNLPQIKIFLKSLILSLVSYIVMLISHWLDSQTIQT